MTNIYWLDRKEYPFHSNFINLDMGRMHYVDEGSGETIVMCHGNPTWSFLYRHMIKGLSPYYRCVAMDYIGFGLSDKPPTWSYLPQEQARNVESLINRLGLKDITLVVQDWGGPVGLSYALRHPHNVKRLVIMNTWMWSVKGVREYEFFSGLMGGPIGRFLIRHFNFFAGPVMKYVTADSSKLDRATHRHYLEPLAQPAERKGSWVFPKHIIASSDWLESLWSQRERIRHIPTLFLWGMSDTSFKARELKRFETIFSNFKTIRFDGVGHFVQEEKKEELVPLVNGFMAATAEQPEVIMV